MKNQGGRGLDCLVEAATALTQLVSSTHTTPQSGPLSKNPHCISDDESASTVIRGTTGQITTSSSPQAESENPPPSFARQAFKNANLKRQQQSSPKPRQDIFPLRLLRMLSDPSVRSVITWLSHGRSFVVLCPDVFAERVLPQYFPESSTDTSRSGVGARAKYPSFTRKLNRWGFRQIARGPDAGAFYHRLFHRDQPELCTQMECQKSRRAKTSSISLLKPDIKQEQGEDRNTDELEEGKSTTLGNGVQDKETASTVRGPLKKRKLSLSPSLETAKSFGAPTLVKRRVTPIKRFTTAADPRITQSAPSSTNSLSNMVRRVCSSSSFPPQLPKPIQHNSEFIRRESLAALQASMDSIRRIQQYPSGSISHAPSSAPRLPVRSPHYEPNIALAFTQEKPKIQIKSISSPEKIAAARKAAEQHRDMLYQAFIQAMSTWDRDRF